MSISRVIAAVALVGLITSSPALADPITSSPESIASAAGAANFGDLRSSMGNLFDSNGAPILQTSGPIYIAGLDEHDKLRNLESNFSFNYNFDGFGGGAGVGGPGFNPGVPPAANLPSFGQEGGNSNRLVNNQDLVAPVPEPATLMLLGPAAFVAMRRRRASAK